MLTTQQQKVVDLHNITSKAIYTSEFVFLIAGKEIRQRPSRTSEGAVRRGIGFVMQRFKK